MRHVRRQQEDLALADRDVDALAVLHRGERDAAFELVEEFLAGIDVEIAAAFGPPTTMMMNSLSVKTCLLPTGGLSRCRCSSIQRLKLKARSSLA